VAIEKTDISLTDAERAALRRHEVAIAAGMDALESTLTALVDIRDRRLYREQYSDFETYCAAQWGKTWKRFRQLMAHQQTVANLSTGGTKVPALKEGQTRPIAHLPAPQQQAIIHSAVARHGEHITGAQIADERDRQIVYTSKISQLIQRMDKGDVKPAKALDLVTALQGCEPKVRGDMLMIEASDSSFIREMNRLFKAKSETYAEVVVSRHLQMSKGSVPVKHATAQHLRILLDEKAAEHRRAAAAQRNGVTVIPIQTTLYQNDVAQTVAAIQAALGRGDQEAVAIALLGGVYIGKEVEIVVRG
jgi:hypothetical protein